MKKLYFLFAVFLCGCAGTSLEKDSYKLIPHGSSAAGVSLIPTFGVNQATPVTEPKPIVSLAPFLDRNVRDVLPTPELGEDGKVLPEERCVVPSKWRTNKLWGPITWSEKWQDFDFTGVGWSYDGGWFGGALVGPRHMVMARHYSISTARDANGKPVRRVVFHDPDGTPVTRYPLAKKTVYTLRTNTITGTKDPVLTDITCVILNEDVPSDIAVYPVVNSDGYKLNNGLAILTNQFKEAWPKYINQKVGISGADRPDIAYGTMISWKAAFLYNESGSIAAGTQYDPEIRPWEQSLVKHDSGHPAFAVIGIKAGKPVLSLLATHTTTTSGACYWSGEVQKQIIKTFAELEKANPVVVY